jgi:hypothetical protein
MNDERDLDAIDDGLVRLFAEEAPVPPDFTVTVLRRVAEARWRGEARLAHVFYAGLCISGVLVIAGIGVAAATFPVLSGNAAIAIALVGVALGSLVPAALRFETHASEP